MSETTGRKLTNIPPNSNPVLAKVMYRYLRYKPQSQQFKKGIIGRWQQYNGYGWSNCDEPLDWESIDERD